MRKQVDWDVRVWRLTPSGQEGTQTREQMLTYMKEFYPAKDGWEVIDVMSPGYDGGAVNLVVFVAKYEDVFSVELVAGSEEVVPS